MGEDQITGQQKYQNYKEQFIRLNRALAAGFNLEAMFIEYAIMEDRTESILCHAERWENYLKKRKGRGPNIDSKIKYIQSCAGSGVALMGKYFSDNLLDEILVWKEERNRLIHALIKQQLGPNEVRGIAEKGNDLVKELRTRTGKYNRAIDKVNQRKEI